MLPADLHAQLAEISSMYYEEEITQSAIAERLGLSRVKIYRLLKQAKEEQVVADRHQLADPAGPPPGRSPRPQLRPP